MKKEFYKKIIVAFLLFIIIFTGFLFRIYKVDSYPLWSDEGETIINAQQVLSEGYPHGYYKGVPQFENYISIPAPSEDEMYAHVPRNYLGSKYENNKGWLTYYLLAGWFKLAGFTTFNARFLFIIFSILSIFLLYLITRELYSPKTALIASAFYAVNIPLVEYGRMCRYFSLLILLVFLSLYFFIKLCQTNKNKYYYLITLSLILLFHTHIISFMATSLFIIYYWFFNKKERINKQIIINFTLLLLFTIPWIFLVRFWVNFSTQGSLDWKLQWLVSVFVYIFTIYFLNTIFNFFRKNKKRIDLSKLSFLEIFIIIYIFISVLLVPSESAHHRIFLPIFVLFNILLVIYFRKIFLEKNLRYLFIFLIIIINGYLFWSIKIDYKVVYRPYWIWQARDYLQDNNVPANIPIYLRNCHQSLNVIIPNKVLLIDAMKREYLDNTKEEFYFFTYIKDFCPFLNNERLCIIENASYKNIIERCPTEQINDDLRVFHCNQHNL